MPELLLEVGCEELPATFVQKAYSDLLEHVWSRAQEAGLLEPDATSQCLGTPRRLIVQIVGIRSRQEDRTEEIRGPGLKAAFDADGQPTQALLGFCRKNEADPNAVRKDEQYVWVTKQIVGRSAEDVLSEILPTAIRSLAFDKSMRWGSSRMRFARPIRWILAALGGKSLPFDIEGVESGMESRGHRFYAPAPFAAGDLETLLKELRSRNVEPDAAVRKQRIVEQTHKVAQGSPDLPEELVDENTFLTEWPTAVAGHYKEEFKNLPPQVLVTAMAKHEKMFPVRGADGKLTTQFVFIRNSGEDDTVRAGNEWVLNARFNDAKFFYEQDIRHDLERFLERTRTIVFQEKLGNVRDRADRLAGLNVKVAEATGADEAEKELARLAGRYCKADLATGLVSELASLQGVVGGEYAKREGKLPEAVCWALASHYDLGKNPTIGDASARTAVRTLITDQLDKLVGYLGLGLRPSGSSDPYGLRRAATLLIEAAWRWPNAFFRQYDALLLDAETLYQVDLPQRANVVAGVADIFRSRYESLLETERKDVLDAACVPHALDKAGHHAALNPRLIRVRVAALNAARQDEAFVQTATRPLNIAGAALKKGLAFGDAVTDPLVAAMTAPESRALIAAVERASAACADALAEESPSALFAALQGFVGPINAFFDKTMVMDEDEKVRTANLTLVNATAQVLLQAGDVSRLVFEGV